MNMRQYTSTMGFLCKFIEVPIREQNLPKKRTDTKNQGNRP